MWRKYAEMWYRIAWNQLCHRGPNTWMVSFCWQPVNQMAEVWNVTETRSRNTNNLKLPSKIPIYAGKYAISTLWWICEKYGNKRNKRQAHIRIKLDMPNSQTRLSGQHWDPIMSTHLGRVSTCPCFILYIVSKRDQTNDIHLSGHLRGGSVAEWLVCWTQPQKKPGFKSQPQHCRVTVLGKLFTPIVPLFTKQRNW